MLLHRTASYSPTDPLATVPSPEFENLDIASNRTAQKYPWREMVLQVLWMVIGKPLFWISSRPLFGWRRWLLRRFGATIGQGVNTYPSAV